MGRRIELAKPRGFSLRAASEFYASFTPGSGMAAAATDRLTLVFRLDHTFEAVGVEIDETDDSIVLRVTGAEDTRAIAKQVTRMLGLDEDGEAWAAVGRRDPVVGKLQREFRGFFTAAKGSPYDAATWGVIAPRLSVPAAAKIKIRMACAFGDEVVIGGRSHPVFPSPRALKEITHVEGLSDEKLERLKGIADAALAGKLDAEHLRALGEERALAELQRLRGVGPWTASHIYFRGAGPVDSLPTIEPRILAGWGAATGIAHPTEQAFREAAEAWRPFRLWVTILLMRFLSRSGGWNGPGLAKARKDSIRRTTRSKATQTRLDVRA